ncbi:MAG: hypothetical protein KDD69_11325, partial [Bdellovibrionales bacterium]|nr:hypothetical protein [Bdellovibrionales bacterium]
YTLLFSKSGEAAWQAIPEDAQPLLLRPVVHLASQLTHHPRSGKQLLLQNDPKLSTITDAHVGYYLDGTIYDHQGRPVDLSSTPHRSLIERQVTRARSFSTEAYRGPGEIRVYNEQTGRREVLSEPLLTIETLQGRRIEGVRFTPEAQKLLAQAPPPGMTLVLTRLPRDIELGGRQREAVSFGRGIRSHYWWGTQQPVDTITADDLGYAKVDGEHLVIHSTREATAHPFLQAVGMSETTAESGGTTAAIPLMEVKHQERLQGERLLEHLAADDDIRFMHSASMSLHQTLSQLQASLQAHGEGSSREAFVEFVREQAVPMHDFLTSSDTAERVERLEVLLTQLKEVQRGVAGSESEILIDRQVQAIEEFVSVARDPKLRHVVETLLDTSKFGPDNWTQWSQTELPVLVGAVGGAVAGTALVVGTAGTAGVVVVPLWATALGGAAGGLIGSELAHEGVHQFQERFGDARAAELTYGQRALVVQKFSGKEVFSEASGQYEDLSWGHVTSTYSKQLATNFVLSYATMIGSQALAGRVSTFLERSTVLDKISGRSSAARSALRYLSDAQSRGLSSAEQQRLTGAFRQAFARLPTEFLEEMQDEALEAAGEEFLNTIARHMHLSEGGYEGNLGALLVGTVRGVRVQGRSIGYDSGNEVVSGQVTEFLQAARDEGYVVTPLGKGYFTVLNPSTSERYTLRPNRPGQKESAPQAPVSPDVPPMHPSQRLAFDQSVMAYQQALAALKEQYPNDWQQRVNVDLTDELEALLREAHGALAAQGVATEVERDREGRPRALVVVAESGGSELNTYAERMRRARGVQLRYDPNTLAEERAGALFERDSKTIFLPHEVVTKGVSSQQLYHEKVHSVLNRIRAEGGDSLFFGAVEHTGGAFSLEEIVTYTEVMNRVLKDDTAPMALRLLHLDEHVAVLSESVQHLSRLLNSDATSIAHSFSLPFPEEAGAASQLPSEQPLTVLAHGAERLLLERNTTPLGLQDEHAHLDVWAHQRLALLREVTQDIESKLETIRLLRDEGVSDPAALQQPLSELRALVGRHTLLPRVQSTAAEPGLQTLQLPRTTPSFDSLRRVATHESTIDDDGETENLLDLAIRATLGSAKTDEFGDQSEQAGPIRATARPSIEQRFDAARSPFALKITKDSIKLQFDSGELFEVPGELTLSGAHYLVREVRAHANGLAPNIANLRDLLRTLTQSAQLFGEFHASDASPGQAAEQLRSFLQQNSFPATKITIAEGSSQRQRNDAVVEFADALERYANAVESHNRDEQINEDTAWRIQEKLNELSQKYEDQRLERAIAATPTTKRHPLFVHIAESALQEQRRTEPVQITLEGPLLHDRAGNPTSFRFSLERSRHGTLRVIQLEPTAASTRGEIRSLSSLVDVLQAGTQLSPDSSPEWRFYGTISDAVFGSEK